MKLRGSLCALLLVTVAGCGTADPAPETAAVVPPVVPVTLKPQLLDSASLPPELTAEPRAEPDPPVTSETAEEPFEPPYPNRENLFLAPKRTSTHAQTSGSTNQTIDLLGFANVDRPKVILSINGQVVPISEGEQQAGIEVISIQPPAVVLQRDRERWQATLEN